MSDYDVIVVGAGHAGMMTATYLARAGLDVLILEKGLEVGGVGGGNLGQGRRGGHRNRPVVATVEL